MLLKNDETVVGGRPHFPHSDRASSGKMRNGIMISCEQHFVIWQARCIRGAAALTRINAAWGNGAANFLTKTMATIILASSWSANFELLAGTQKAMIIAIGVIHELQRASARQGLRTRRIDPCLRYWPQSTSSSILYRTGRETSKSRARWVDISLTRGARGRLYCPHSLQTTSKAVIP